MVRGRGGAATHGTWQHIAPQVSRQLAAVAGDQTRETLVELALRQLEEVPSAKQIFAELGIGEIGIHRKLQEILRKRPTIAIPIDAIPKDLKEWILTLRHEAKIWVIEKYVSSRDSTRVLYSIPDENLPTLSTRSEKGQISTVTRSSSPWRDLIETGALRDGAELKMVYVPAESQNRPFMVSFEKAALRLTVRSIHLAMQQ